MIHALSGIICLYAIIRFTPSLPLPFAGKCFIALILMAASQVHLLSRGYFGNLASPEWPFHILLIMGWLFGSFFLLAIFLLLKDAGAAFFFVLAKLTPLPLVLPFSGARVNLALAFAAPLLAAIGLWQAVRVPDVRPVEIVLDRLPAELDGLRLVQLSDLHASRLLQEPWQQAVVDKANALNPDLILITGDLVDGTPANRAADVAPLRGLKARLGVLAAPGNHEYYSNYKAWMASFASLGLRVLSNEHVVIRDREKGKGHALVVAGTTDRNAARFGLPMPDIKTALWGAPEKAPVILMAHQPRETGKNAAAGVDLQLSGHTHGGQIAGLHFIVQAANEGFVSGLYRIGAMQLYINSGTGLWNGFPIRLGRPSEITLIHLRSGSRIGQPSG